MMLQRVFVVQYVTNVETIIQISDSLLESNGAVVISSAANGNPIQILAERLKTEANMLKDLKQELQQCGIDSSLDQYASRLDRAARLAKKAQPRLADIDAIIKVYKSSLLKTLSAQVTKIHKAINNIPTGIPIAVNTHRVDDIKFVAVGKFALEDVQDSAREAATNAYHAWVDDGAPAGIFLPLSGRNLRKAARA